MGSTRGASTAAGRSPPRVSSPTAPGRSRARRGAPASGTYPPTTCPRTSMTSDDRAELARLRAAVISTLTTLRAELDAPTLTRSVVAEHNLADLAALVGVEWKPPT